jgi:hypothetical protein
MDEVTAPMRKAIIGVYVLQGITLAGLGYLLLG